MSLSQKKLGSALPVIPEIATIPDILAISAIATIGQPAI